MKKPAVIIFLVYCGLLAGLLLAGVLSGITSGILFALGLVVFGITSRGPRG